MGFQDLEIPRKFPKHDEGGRDNVDRISGLPDHIVDRILSFLHTKSAIRTSVLASRWRYMWTNITRLDFRDNYKETEGFSDYVDYVLLRCGPHNIREFQLHCSCFSDLSCIDKWVGIVLSPKLSKLILYVSPKGEYFPEPPLPRCTLTCNMLETLILESRFDVRISPWVNCFPHLKTLYITGVYPEDNKAMQKLFSSCPILEDLHLKGYLVKNEVITFDISMPMLKRLQLELKTDGFGCWEHNVVINTPCLEYLSIEDNSFARYMVKNLNSICQVSIDFAGYRVKRAGLEHVNRLTDLIKGLSNTKDLHLSAETTGVLALAGSTNWPTYSNLTKLSVWAYECFSLSFLPDILRSSPNLKELSFTKDFLHIWYPKDDNISWTLPTEVPRCLLESINKIELQSLRGRKDEVGIVEYLLKNARVLDLLRVGFFPRALNEELLEKLDMLPKPASKSCRVEFFAGPVCW